MELGDIYENIQHRNANKNTFGPHNQTEAQNCRKWKGRSRWLVLITVCLGLICLLLVAALIMLYLHLTADRDMMKMSYMNITEEYNETLSSLKINYSQLTEERDQLQNSLNSTSQKKLELETELKKQQNNFSSMSQKKLELETELKKQQNNFNSMSQKKLELETELKKRDSQRGVYFISSEQKSWSDSRKFCRDRGSDLVIINSIEEQRFITSVIKEHVWIGLSDIENEGVMKWVDGTRLNNGFWLQGEPNNAGDEDCVEILFQLKPENNWNDRPCTELRKGICEK